MKPHFRWLCVLFFLVTCSLAPASMVSPVESPVSPVGDGTYRITVKAGHKLTRNTEKLKAQAIDAATKFCAKDGRQLKIVNVEEDKAMYLVGDVAHVTLTFKALAASDPELAASVSAGAGAYTPPPAPAPKPLTTDELKAELTKLDEMRKGGLINDADFAQLKQKLLSRY